MRRTSRCKFVPNTKRANAGQAPDNVAKCFGVIANIDDNSGALLPTLKEWGIEENALVIFMNDNGGTARCKLFNAGMRGSKVTPWQGGPCAASFWRWRAHSSPSTCRR
jgi:arylsulfatase